MHGGQHAAFRPGRGFVSSMSEPEPAEATEPDDATPQQAWADVHAALTSDYEQRLSEHNIAVAKSGRSEQRRSDFDWANRSQAVTGGQYGFKRFWREGRTELSGTPAYANDWRQINRPQVQEGIGPMGGSRIGSIVQRQTSQKALANRGAELESEGFVLGLLRDDDTAAEPSTSSSTAPSTPSGEASPWPRRSGALPKASQWNSVRFEGPDPLPTFPGMKF